MRISHTKLTTFEQCALRYRLTYVEKLPRSAIPWLAVERRIHSILATYHAMSKVPPAAVGVDELLALHDKAWDIDLRPENRDNPEYVEGEEILRAYLDLEARRPHATLRTEYRVGVIFGEHYLYGDIDRVDDVDGAIEIVDYKLDRKVPPGNPAATSKQLSLYHLLLYEADDMYAETVSLLYLRAGVMKSACRSMASLDETRDWILRTLAAIGAEKRWEPELGDGCKSCAYHSLCPAKTGVERQLKPIWQQQALPLW